ncbi:MAG: cyclic nucleotide-binding domain-containing protein [Pseudomonadota bacterium]
MPPCAATLLRRLPSATDLPRRDVARLVKLAEERQLASGEILFRQGDPADHIYLVLRGSLLVRAVVPGGDELVLGLATTGDIIGEMGLLECAPRSATLACEAEATLLVIGRDSWDALVAHDDAIARWLLERCAEGLARRIEAVMERIVAASQDPCLLHHLPKAPRPRRRGLVAWLLGLGSA